MNIELTGDEYDKYAQACAKGDTAKAQEIIEKAQQKKNEDMYEWTLQWLADTFKQPCQYRHNGKSVSKVIPMNWCEEHCDDGGGGAKECWRIYLESLRKEQENGLD